MKSHEFEDGHRMPVLGLGTWKAGPGDTWTAVREALRVGYRHIDCAPVYDNEPEIGDALAAAFREGLVPREEVWITSKLWCDAHRPEHVLPALRRTLAHLKLDYLDLYLVHWPVALRPGVFFPASPDDLVPLSEIPLAETWRGMEAAREAGLCRHIGVSNFSIPKVRSLLDVARIPPALNQIELHPYLQQPELVSFCREHGVHVTAYSPLGSRDRPPTLQADDDPDLLVDPTIRAIAQRVGGTPAQVLISWAIHRDTSVIPKSVNPRRIAENFAAVELALDDDDMREVAALDRRRRYVGGEFWALAGGPYTLTDLWDA